jgi:hypothetical protein
MESQSLISTGAEGIPSIPTNWHRKKQDTDN